MRLQPDSITRSLLVGALALALALLVLAGFGAFQANAGGTDLSGAWNVRYLLSCDAALTQSGSAITGTVECGEFSGTLEGTYSAASGDLSLTGTVEIFVPIAVEGTVTDSGDSMSGTFTALPYVPDGTFEGERVGAGGAGDLTGDWTVVVDGVFSGDCTIDVEHNGSAVETTGECGPVPNLDGNYNSATREITLAAMVFNTELTIEGTVSSSGDSIEGTWVIAADPPLGGVLLGERVGGSPPTDTPEDDSPDTPEPDGATPTVAAPALPGTGGGPSASTSASSWAHMAIVLGGVALLLTGVGYARRRQV